MKNKFLIIALFLLAASANAKIDRFFKVDEGFYRGGQPSAYQDFVNLKNKGIKTVINLRKAPEVSAQEQKIVEGLGMKYINVPYSSFSYPTRKEIADLMGMVTDKNLRPVFLHCKHGKDRTGVVGVLYRVQEQKWSVQRAYNEALKLDIRWCIPTIPQVIYRETGTWPAALPQYRSDIKVCADFVFNNLPSF